jgi:hypothetical protein
MSRPKRTALALALSTMALFSLFCSEETPRQAEKPSAPPAQPAPDPAPATHLRVHRLTLENATFNGQLGVGYGNLYEGRAYGGQDAAANAARIDFRHQYRGADISNQRSFESMSTKSRWDGLGLFTEATTTASRIKATDIDEKAFEQVEDDTDLLASFAFDDMAKQSPNHNRRAYLSNADDEPLSAVFAFIDKDGRRGLFKVVAATSAPVDSSAPIVARGEITIEIKIEDRSMERP